MADKDLFDTNGTEVSDWFETSAEELKEDAQEMLQQATDETYAASQREVPVDTGDLKNSLTKADYEVYSSLHYAPHVGLGTIYHPAQDYLWGPAAKEIKKALQALAKD